MVGRYGREYRRQRRHVRHRDPGANTGATDGRFLNAAGVPTYGLSGMFHDAEGPRAHGLNERIRVKSLMDGRRFLYEVVKLYANDAE
jgi:acetylornithine deacetylase/succinyl-diaminopimelate desuccinylase-like protein